MDEVYKNEELNTLIYTIGAGVGQSFDVDDSNYDKVIIMTDADVDGAHIRILLLTNTIKLVGNSISGKAQFQHIKGDMKGIEVLAEPNENYCSLKEFLKANNAEHNEEYFKKVLNKKQHKRLYSTKGLITVWSKKDLEEILKNSKSLIRRIFGDK